MADAETVLGFSIDPRGAKSGSAETVKALEAIRAKARESADGWSSFEQTFKHTVDSVRSGLSLMGAGFVGLKMAELAPMLHHPVSNLTVRRMLSKVADQEVQRYNGEQRA